MCAAGVKADDRALAKDVRIFGMHGWLEEIHQKQQALDRLDYLIYRMKNPKE